MKTITEIVAEVRAVRPLSARQIQRHLLAAGIAPLGARQRPQQWSDSAGRELLSYLGIQPESGKRKAEEKPSAPPAEALPPHSPDMERAALGCVLLAGMAGSQSEVDALLAQLRTPLFYDLNHQRIFAGMVHLRMESHAVDLITLAGELKRDTSLKEVLGDGLLLALSNEAVSLHNFPTYLAELQRFWLRRWTKAKSAEFAQLADAEDVSAEDLTRRFGEVHEFAGKITSNGKAALKIPLIAWDDIETFKPDPKSYLIGENIISYGNLFAISGRKGLGKSRLLNTLAFAGARGRGDWMGYKVRRRWKTLVLITSTEGSMLRLKEEIAGLPASYAGWVYFSICQFDFTDPNFRNELAKLYAELKFDMLLIDHWSDVAQDTGKADYMMAMNAVLSALPAADLRPAIGFASHIRKSR